MRAGPWSLVVGLVCSVALIVPAHGQSDGWQRILTPYHFEFPKDHASHPESKLEWWYYTGNVSASDGHQFGYQLTFFRVGVNLQPPGPSRWAVRDLFMAHFAVTDITGNHFQFAELLNRHGVGWAGAAVDRYRVWNEGWEARLDPDGTHYLHASRNGMVLDLRLQSTKPPVDQGINGISQKGSAPGNASRYYSLTRMSTSGTITLHGRHSDVHGFSWMDHEFGTSFLESAQQGWNWLALQLDDNTEVMIYELRRADGRRDPHSTGSLIDETGRRTPLSTAEFSIIPAEQWTSSQSGASYPIEWTLQLPRHNGRFHLKAAVREQELVTQSAGVTYWEGAVLVDGLRNGRSVHGRGYLEMTGYAGTGMSAALR